MTDVISTRSVGKPGTRPETQHGETNCGGGTTRILAGSGRSGTTWILDALCQANNLRPIFEPLHPAAWRKAAGFAHKYAQKDDRWPELQEFWAQILDGQFSRVWSDYRVRPDRLRPRIRSFRSLSGFKRYLAHWLNLYHNRIEYGPKRANPDSLIKVIRANLMVSWLAIRPQTKIAFIIRHPGSVVESQLRLRGDWNAKAIAALYSGDERLDRRLGVSWRELSATASNDAELFTMIWCLENMVPIQDCSEEDSISFVFYEDLAMHDALAWRQLLDSLGLKRAPDIELLTQPSQQASTDLRRQQIDQSHLGQSLKRLSAVDRSSIQGVLERFGVDFYCVDSIEPVRSKLPVNRRDNWSHLIVRSA